MKVHPSIRRSLVAFLASLLGGVGLGCAGPADSDPVAKDPAPFDVGHPPRLAEMTFVVALARRVSGWLAESCRAVD